MMKRGRPIKDTRKYGGKVYKWQSSTKSKSVAKKRAESIRKSGTKARITKKNKWGEYRIMIRRGK